MPQPNEPDELQFESYGSYLAYMYRRSGAKTVQDGLAEIAASGRIPREYLEMVGAELRAARLPRVAQIVESYAPECPDGMDLRFCRYTKPPYNDDPSTGPNVAAWRRSQSRFMNSLREQRDKWLRLAGIEPE